MEENDKDIGNRVLLSAAAALISLVVSGIIGTLFSIDTALMLRIYLGGIVASIVIVDRIYVRRSK